MGELTLDQDSAGGIFKVVVGDTITLTLRENPTTGFRWQLEPRPSQLLAPEGAHFTVGPHPGVGSGGVRTWRFRAITPGPVVVDARLGRAWEGEAAAIERFSVSLDISPADPSVDER
ncbi:inhibitor of cysteine peptidase [Microlunatus panaciterrae]|uniref:Inhibitor of cysteine peptidase n=1 Tax=Microlunatus panaciterrae TaxID=400768 RepID=A0ABS2RK65_9ACTN|nr:protease inhibitor I42 family protein [Microlunatus panaciterrae]MBM7799400.1 inhibitor of cysteine peptidase [Microlunatus panaciterrae]